jgi:hypothetical protein
VDGAILDHDPAEVKTDAEEKAERELRSAVSAFPLKWREDDRFVQRLDFDPASPAKDGKCQVKASRREQDVLRDDPEPLADIQGGKKCRYPGHQVKVGQAVIQEPGQPDFFRREFFETAGQVLGGTWINLLGCSSRYHLPDSYRHLTCGNDNCPR